MNNKVQITLALVQLCRLVCKSIKSLDIRLPPSSPHFDSMATFDTDSYIECLSSCLHSEQATARSLSEVKRCLLVLLCT